MDRVYRINLRGVFAFCHSVIPHMLERDYGRIVNIASIAGKEGNPRMVPYSATKAAVIGLTKSVGKELAKSGIRVNCVTPAVVHTRILDELTPEQVQYMVDRIPIGTHRGGIDEIAALVAWLASEDVLLQHRRRLRHKRRQSDLLNATGNPFPLNGLTGVCKCPKCS